MKSKIHPAWRMTNCTAAFATLAGALGLPTYSISFQGIPNAVSVIPLHRRGPPIVFLEAASM